MALYYPPSVNGLQKTLDAQLDSGVTASVTLNNVTNVQNKPGVFVVNRIDADDNLKDAADREFISFTGTSGSTLTGLTRNVDGGSSDQDHAVGSVVEFIPDVIWAEEINTTIAAEHSTAGVHDNTKVAMLAGAQTLTGAKTFTTGLLKAVDVTSGAGVSTLPTSTDTLVARATTDTLTNKRITKRVTTIVSNAEPTVNTDNCDVVTITALATAITSMTTNLSGTPTNFQSLIIRIKDDGTARAITWGASFEAKGVALPTTTTISKVLTVGLIYDTVTSKWGCVAVANEV
jgi:hypothetical protein